MKRGHMGQRMAQPGPSCSSHPGEAWGTCMKFKRSILWRSAFLIVQFSHPYMTTGKTIALTKQTIVGKVMSLFFNMLSRFVTAFLPRSKSLLISWLQSPSAVIWESKKINSHSFHCFPIYLPWMDGTGCHDLSFWVLSFKPAFSLSSFIVIKRLFSSSSLFVIRVVSSAYLTLLIFQSEISVMSILIPPCASSSPAFHMLYSAYKLNKQGDNIQPWHTPFPIWNQSVAPRPVLLLLDLHTDFSGGRAGGLVFPSLSEFSTVCCNPHVQRLWHSQ